MKNGLNDGSLNLKQMRIFQSMMYLQFTCLAINPSNGRSEQVRIIQANWSIDVEKDKEGKYDTC